MSIQENDNEQLALCLEDTVKYLDIVIKKLRNNTIKRTEGNISLSIKIEQLTEKSLFSPYSIDEQALETIELTSNLVLVSVDD